MKLRLMALSMFLSFLLPPMIFSQVATDPKIIEGAKKEGEIVWYTSMAVDQSKPIVDRFHTRFPFVKPVLHRSGGGALMNKVLTEARAGRYAFDVVGGRGEMILSFKEKGLIAAYKSPETKLMDPDLYDRQGFWYTYYVVPTALGYNTKQVKKEEVPKTYEGLLDPRWKGKKISMDNEAYLLVQGLMSIWGREKTLDYMRKLAAQDPVLARGNTERVALTGAGEYPLVLAYAHAIEREKFKGATIDWIALEPAVVEIDPLMVGSKAPHPNAARLFLDFLLSKEGQEMLVEFQRIPVRSDVEPKPARLFRGYQRVVERPDDYKYFADNVKLFQEIFRTR
ncbi:MAG: extracellular solute-binding protein [Deltaproteobacteria bacterium]|nr:extracellular solute-binding protein [Deltaproteobacteria bacterium]